MPTFLFAAIAAFIIIGGLLIPQKAWALPFRANAYAADIMAAERTNGMPNNLLARLLYQESRFRQDIISGEVKSSAGAVGIAQIVPRWHPNVDPTNAIASIYYAAGFLSDQRRRFGTWPLALSAYNFGPSATEKTLRAHGTQWLEFVPKETRNYVEDIISDVPRAA